MTSYASFVFVFKSFFFLFTTNVMTIIAAVMIMERITTTTTTTTIVIISVVERAAPGRVGVALCAGVTVATTEGVGTAVSEGVDVAVSEGVGVAGNIDDITSDILQMHIIPHTTFLSNDYMRAEAKITHGPSH